MKKLFFMNRYKKVNVGMSDEISAKLKEHHYVMSGIHLP
jgi:hypothetical protein